MCRAQCTNISKKWEKTCVDSLRKSEIMCHFGIYVNDNFFLHLKTLFLLFFGGDLNFQEQFNNNKKETLSQNPSTNSFLLNQINKQNERGTSSFGVYSSIWWNLHNPSVSRAALIRKTETWSRRWGNLTEDCFKLIDWLFYLKWLETQSCTF